MRCSEGGLVADTGSDSYIVQIIQPRVEGLWWLWFLYARIVNGLQDERSTSGGEALAGLGLEESGDLGLLGLLGLFLLGVGRGNGSVVGSHGRRGHDGRRTTGATTALVLKNLKLSFAADGGKEGSNHGRDVLTISDADSHEAVGGDVETSRRHFGGVVCK